MIAKIYLILLIILTLNQQVLSQNRHTKIIANDSLLIINDSAIYSKNSINYSSFKDLKKIFKHKKYFKVKENNSKITYFFKNKGIGLMYGWKDSKGTPSLYIYYKLDTVWWENLYKNKYKSIGKFQDSLNIFGFEINENTTISQLKNNPVFHKYFEANEINKNSIIKIQDKKLEYTFCFLEYSEDAKIANIVINYFWVR